MLWLGPLVLAAATPAVTPGAGPVASTYDEAACAEGAEPAAVRAAAQRSDDEAPPNCSEPPPPITAVIDCNDLRASLWVGAMIGSCDMPRPAGPTLAATVKAGSGARMCSGDHCGFDQIPLRPAQRGDDGTAPLALSAQATPHLLVATPLDHEVSLAYSQAHERRLERPPRLS
jgi:hypothetical protein